MDEMTASSPRPSFLWGKRESKHAATLKSYSWPNTIGGAAAKLKRWKCSSWFSGALFLRNQFLKLRSGTEECEMGVLLGERQ